MKSIYAVFIAILVGFTFQSVATAQSSSTTKIIKKYINNTVKEVEQEHDVTQKRLILNESFDMMINAYDRIEAMNIPENDAEAIALLKANIMEKRNELNGEQGFKRVDNSNLNNFAQYVQDDFEQADRTIVISVTTALLVVIILLLIL